MRPTLRPVLATPLLACAFALAACDDSPTGPKPLDQAARRDPQACAECHPDHVREWSGSMHAYAAEDPVFRAMNARGQRVTKGALGTLCLRCHAPVAVALGLTTDGSNLDDLPAWSKGVTCDFCHSVDAVEGESNNPLHLRTDGVFGGGIAEPTPNTAHASVHSPLHDGADLRSARLCGACHDVVTPAGVALERTLVQWRASIYSHADTSLANSCVACHMPGRDDVAAEVEGVPLRRVHDHGNAAIDVALRDFPEREAQREKVQRALDATVLAELCVIEASGGADIEIYLENVGAGHDFPSGAAADRRVWLDLDATADGASLLHLGGIGPGEAPPEPEEAGDLWMLREILYDEAGALTHDFWAAAHIEGETLPAPNGVPPGEPGYLNVHVPRRFRVLGGPPDRVEMNLRLQPIGLDVLEDLVATGDLDPAVLAAMPTFTLAGASLVWTPETAERRTSPASQRDALCVGFNARSRRNTPPGR